MMSSRSGHHGQAVHSVRLVAKVSPSQVKGPVEDGFRIQASLTSAQGVVIQAQKGGFLAGIIDADRALTITISGAPADFTVRVGIGKWLEHLGVVVIETLLISDLFLPIDVAETALNFEVEDKLIKDLRVFVG